MISFHMDKHHNKIFFLNFTNSFKYNSVSII